MVELLTIGDELLLGHTIDGNAAWLSRRLSEAGIRVVRRSTVGDDDASIRDALADALARTGTVLCTGGLGPTQDDRTRDAAAALFDRELVLDEGWLETMRRRFESLGRTMSERNLVQAMVPRGARVLPNPRGTAPGLAIEDDAGRLAILLPGVPHEMRGLTEEQVLPLLAERWPRRGRPVEHRFVRTTGVAESKVAELLADVAGDVAPLTLAFLPGFDGVTVRITSWGDVDAADAAALLDLAAERACERLAGSVYARAEEGLEEVIGRTLAERGLTLALAESCTGGLLAKRMTDRAGASDYFLAGFVTYSNESKQRFVGVAEELLREHGAVSEPVAEAMAEGARRETGADAAVAITGIAGPGGGSPEKPVGTVCVAAALGDRRLVRTLRLPGDREEVRERSAQAGLSLLWRLLAGEAA